ncbi:MAG: Tex-like N-terminal domain-containing protein, partial [Bacteroidia bacterium]
MTDTQLYFKVSDNLKIDTKQVVATVRLLDEGGTIPFIARYRKEATGSLDEVAIMQIRDEMERLRELEKRRDAILKSIEGQGKLTEELKEKLLDAETISKLEDLYLPYKPKRRTKATIAREKGLEPLAQFILLQSNSSLDDEAAKFISTEKEVISIEDALHGARDIIAEIMTEDVNAREQTRNLFKLKATIKSKVVRGREEEGAKFEDYFDWEEPLAQCPSHRLLAMRRGEKEDFLFLDIKPPVDDAIDILNRIFVKAKNECATQLKLAIEDGYGRLLQPSIEAETRSATKELADGLREGAPR